MMWVWIAAVLVLMALASIVVLMSAMVLSGRISQAEEARERDRDITQL